MFALYRILLRLAVAWLLIVGTIAAVAAIRGAFRGHDWSVAVAVPMAVVGPAFFVAVLAWTIKQVQWTQD
jgi:hypothetical protein